MRRTISNLSREYMVSRPLIYRMLKRLGIEREPHTEFTVDDWNMLIKELSTVSEKNKQKKADTGCMMNINVPTAKDFYTEADKTKKISDVNDATLKERLECAKQEYDYNKTLISKFQAETDLYFKGTGKTTMLTNNGVMAAIPSIVNLDKYVKLNISLSKLISDIESDLDLEVDGGDDPFA